jgi:nitrite reductase (NO-forming)
MNRLAGRADWHLRSNVVVIFYLVAALFTGFIQRIAGDKKPSWLVIHLLLLGAASNAIVTWSNHFVSALLWARGHDYRRQMLVLIFLNIGIVGVLVAVSVHLAWLIIAFATMLSLTIVFYLRGITVLVKKSLNKRFVPVIRYYQFAVIFILLGILLGVIDTFTDDKDPWQPRIALAHLHANLLGWVGITIIGTLVTLWPTVLGTQIHARAISFAGKGLKVLLVGSVGTVVSAFLGQRGFLAVSIITYAIGAAVTLTPAVFLMRSKRPDRASSWMLLNGVVGLIVLLVGDVIVIVSSPSPEKILVTIESRALLIFTLWLFPTLLGSLMYLLPVVLGHGPSSTKEFAETLNQGWRWRIFILPTASLFLLLPSMFHQLGEVLTIFALGLFLTLTVRAIWSGSKPEIAY